MKFGKVIVKDDWLFQFNAHHLHLIFEDGDEIQGIHSAVTPRSDFSVLCTFKTYSKDPARLMVTKNGVTFKQSMPTFNDALGYYTLNLNPHFKDSLTNSTFSTYVSTRHFVITDSNSKPLFVSQALSLNELRFTFDSSVFSKRDVSELLFCITRQISAAKDWESKHVVLFALKVVGIVACVAAVVVGVVFATNWFMGQL
jgi:hypothetical protein